MNYHDIPSLHVLSCNTSRCDLELTELWKFVPSSLLALALLSAAHMRLFPAFLPVHTLQQNHSEVFFDLLFPFSTVSLLFSISCLHKMCPVLKNGQLWLNSGSQLFAWTFIAHSHSKYVTWERKYLWNSNGIISGESKAHSSLAGIRKMPPAVSGEASTEGELFNSEYLLEHSGQWEG